MFRPAAVLALTLISTTLLASPFTDRLKQQVADGQMQHAYELALTQFDALVGDPDYDLPFGIAAIDSGHVSEGVFALERVLFIQPDNHRARLEYARGLFMLGDDAQARQAFTRVLNEANPPASVQDKIQQFLDAIRRRESRYQTSAKGYVGLGFGYDDNINSAPTSQLTLFTLNQQSLGRGDQYSKLSFGGQLFYPISKNNKLYGRWDSALRIYKDEHDQDNANHSLTFGSQWNLKQDQFDLSFNGQQYLLDNSRYRKMYGPTAQWTRALRKDLGVQAGLSWLILDHADAKVRDGRQGLFNLRFFGNLDLPMTPGWFAGVFYGDERSDAQSISSLATVDRRFMGAQAGGQLQLKQDLGLNGSVVYQDSNYAGNDIFYGVARDDSYYALDLELKKLLTHNWQVSLNFNYSRNESNIELYEYRRKQMGLTARYDF